jgi:hypothetical protein
MKSLLLLTASGPLLILTSHDSLHDPKLLEELKHKGIGKFVAFEARTRRVGKRRPCAVPTIHQRRAT